MPKNKIFFQNAYIYTQTILPYTEYKKLKINSLVLTKFFYKNFDLISFLYNRRLIVFVPSPALYNFEYVHTYVYISYTIYRCVIIIIKATLFY